MNFFLNQKAALSFALNERISQVVQNMQNVFQINNF